jgi:soluble lytic murein transglycosylase-like protein
MRELGRRGALPTGVVAFLVLSSIALGQPPPNSALPNGAVATAKALVDTTGRLRSEIDAWRASDKPGPPQNVTLDALYQQRIYRLLSRNAPLAGATFKRLPSAVLPFARDVVVAHRELVAITPPLKLNAIRVGPAAAPANLLRWYHEAESRFGIPWRVLGAVNFVESAFGKLRSASAAGAQGPMQFMPSTWRTYGLGGDVHDPHDAIFAAANYLRAAGGRHDIRRALHAYNPSTRYVDAVLRYAREIGADLDNYYDLYSWQVYVKTAAGFVRLTGPGLHSGQSPSR